MRFDIVTIFPEAFESYFNTSMLKRARAKKLVDIHVHNLRNFTSDKHKSVDDKPYGGGPGMVIKIEPLAKAIGSISKIKNQKLKIKNKIKIVVFSASGKQFTQDMARDLAKKYNRIVMVSGHYEGIDERIFQILKAKSYKLQAVSIGPYVLTGGELPAMVVIDAVSRYIPGVLGKGASLEETRYGVGVPVYTRPEVFTVHGKKYRVPNILLSGDHKKIEEWRKQRATKHF